MARRVRVDRTRPRWVLLYALLPLCAGLLTLADYVPSMGGLRTIAEVIVVALVIGLAAVWVQGNRHALARPQVGSEGGAEPRGTRVQVNDSSPQVIDLKSRENRLEG